MRLAERAGLDFLVLDQTRPDIDVPVVQSDRSGTAAFLSPLRARPALRCSGEARMARPADAGKRAQSDSPPYLRAISALRAPETRRGRRAASPTRFRPAQRPCHTRSAGGRKHRRLLRRLFRSGWERSARAPRIARRSCAPVCRSPRSRRASPDHRPGDRLAGPAIGQARSAGVSPPAVAQRGPGRHRTAGRRLLAGDAAARDADVLVLSRFAYLRRRGNDDGAGIAARRRAVQDLRSEDCGRPRHAVHAATGQAAPPTGRIFPGSSCSRCWWTARSCSRSMPPRRRPATERGRPRPRSLGLSRSAVPRAQHGRPARQPAGRSLSLCGRHASAAGGAATLARKADRSAQALGRAFASAISPTRKAAARTSFDPQLRRPATDHARRACAFSRRHRACPVDVEKPGRPRRRRSVGRVRGQAVSVGGRELRARALSGGRQMRRACPRILSLRRRRTRPGADRRPRAGARSAVAGAPHSQWMRPPRRRS